MLPMKQGEAQADVDDNRAVEALVKGSELQDMSSSGEQDIGPHIRVAKKYDFTAPMFPMLADKIIQVRGVWGPSANERAS